MPANVLKLKKQARKDMKKYQISSTLTACQVASVRKAAKKLFDNQIIVKQEKQDQKYVVTIEAKNKNVADNVLVRANLLSAWNEEIS